MSAALKTALAYVYATGRIPKGVRLATWSKVFRLCDNSEPLNYKLLPEAREMISIHPLKLSHDFLIGRGFNAVKYDRRTSHYVSYRNADGDEASAYRDGGATIYHRKPYQRENFTIEQIREELK